jgi:(p)ppGpp synthase/HD superfamily hydrolase
MIYLIEKARLFSVAAHSAIGQRRKYTLEPYWVHPAEVASIVRSVPHTEPMLAAAYLHDVVEDTQVTIEVIRNEFGDIIADMVDWLSDKSVVLDGNRATRKKMDADRLALAPHEVQTIKYADLISNTGTIVMHDPKFAVIYLKEKEYLLSVMDKGDASLRARALQNIASK